MVLGFTALRGSGTYTIEFVAEESALYVTNAKTGRRAGPLLVKSPPARAIYTLTPQAGDGEYAVVFHDTTVLPGRFVIDVDGAHVDISEIGVMRGTQEYGWR